MDASRSDDGDEMRCPGCGYDLRGLPENRCPECGRQFDPAALLAAQRMDPPIIVGRREMIRELQFREIIAVQAVIAFLFSLILDGEALLWAHLISLAAYWAGIAVYLLRHSSLPRNRLIILRFGWILILFAVIFVIAIAQALAQR